MAKKTEVKKDPVAVLRGKLAELQKLSQDNHLDVNDAILQLKKELDTALRKNATALSAWDRVLLARSPERPYTLDYIALLFTDFVELCGDRRFSDDQAIVGGKTAIFTLADAAMYNAMDKKWTWQ